MNLNERKKDYQTESLWYPFILKISVAIVIFSFIFFIALFFRNNYLIEIEHKIRARSYYEHIIITRGWISKYGGVYIEKKGAVKSNPYLKHPDIKAVDGKTYTLRNPSLATIEISEYAKTNNLFSYHMTSLNPVNPSNISDEFEKRALNSFEQGEKELWIKEKKDGKIYFRYMSPVFREESCLVCHVEQEQRDKTDKEKRNIRGGISVKFDISRIENSLRIHGQIILFLGILSTSVFLGIIYCFTARLMKELSKSQQKIQEMAITDDLTKLYNRRYFHSKLTEEFKKAKRYKRDIGCIMIDIDFFKKVNDNYGHHTGDDVLRNISDTIKATCRSIDTIARYGGEEIVILLPETDKEKSFLLAEKIRKIVEKKEIPYDQGESIQITISSGVSGFLSGELEKVTDPNQLVKDADIALYQAKTNGRNRVEIHR